MISVHCAYKTVSTFSAMRPCCVLPFLMACCHRCNCTLWQTLRTSMIAVMPIFQRVKIFNTIGRPWNRPQIFCKIWRKSKCMPFKPRAIASATSPPTNSLVWLPMKSWIHALIAKFCVSGALFTLNSLICHANSKLQSALPKKTVPPHRFMTLAYSS